MQIKFEPSGTHEKRGQAKVRLDFYSEPSEKSYAQHYVRVPVIPEGGYPGKVNEFGEAVDQADRDAWEAKLPHIWQFNPALCVFIGVDENITKKLLTDYIGDIYKPDVLATIDDIMSRPSTLEHSHLSAHLISPYMRGKTGLSAAKTVFFDEQAKAYVNQRLAGFQIKGPGDGRIERVEPQSIDLGPGATDRANNQGGVYGFIDEDNPANASGTLDTWELWYYSNGISIKVATAYLVSGSNFTSRDSETIGSVTAGSKQTFTGLSTDVQTGDYAYVSQSSISAIEWTGSGSPAAVCYGTNVLPFTNSTFTRLYGRACSVYATGTEAGGPTLQDVGDGILTIASTLNRMTCKSPGAGSVGISSAVSNIFRRLMAVGSGAVGLAGAVASIFKQFKSLGSGSLSSAGTLGRMTAKSIGSGAVSIAGAVNRLIKKSIGSGSVGLASTLGRIITKGVGSGSLTIASTLGRMIALGVGGGAVGLSNTLQAILLGATIFYQAVGSGAIGMASTLGRLVSKAVGSGSLTIASALGRLTSKAVGSGSISLASVLGRVIKLSTGGGALTIASTLGRLIAKGVGAGAVGISGALSSIYGIIKTIALTLAARIRSFTLKSRTTSFTLPARTRSFTLPERD